MAKGKKKTTRRKKSMFKVAKGVVYTGAIVAPMYQAYDQLSGTTADRVVGVLKCMAFMDPTTSKFSFAHGAQVWGPLGGITLLDWGTSKLGLQRRVSSAISGLLG